MKTLLAIGAAALALTACSSPDTKSTVATGGTSFANSCIRPSEIKAQNVVSDTEIRFELRNGEVWKNTLDHTCPNLKSEKAFSWEIYGNLVCSRQQLIHVKYAGTCQLGEFVKLPPEPKPAT